MENSSGVILAFRPQDYEIFEYRLNKPLSLKDPKDSSPVHFVLQPTDKIKVNAKHTLEYFIPNNIALLLSISDKALKRALDIYKNDINPDKPKNDISKITKENKANFLKDKSKINCDYIEEIETAIVFSYTAVEAFANISIPENYTFQSQEKEGILYQKKAIERWTSLVEKVSKILPDIYKAHDIKSKRFWNNFKLLEDYRNSIIHQKTVDRVEFFKTYFKDNISDICKSGEQVMRYFYDAHTEKNKTNPLWPWLIGKEKDFPITLGNLDKIVRHK